MPAVAGSANPASMARRVNVMAGRQDRGGLSRHRHFGSVGPPVCIMRHDRQGGTRRGAGHEGYCRIFRNRRKERHLAQHGSALRPHAHLLDRISGDIGHQPRIHRMSEGDTQTAAALRTHGPGFPPHLAQMGRPIACDATDRRCRATAARRIDPSARHQPLSAGQLHRPPYRGPLIQLDPGRDIGFRQIRAIVDGDRYRVEISEDHHARH